MRKWCSECGSYAINHHCHGRDGSEPDLCDVCYWRKRNDHLLSSMRCLYGDYVRMMEVARDRIMELGGDCDPVDKMEMADPSLIAARAVISKANGEKA